MTRDHEWFTLSKFTQPTLLNGCHSLSPQGFIPGPDRIEYLEGMVTFANWRLKNAYRAKSKAELQTALRLIRGLPFSNMLLNMRSDGNRVHAEEIPGIRDYISFNPDSISVAFMDGRDRRRSTSLALSVGKAASAFGSVLPLLVKGTNARELKRAALRAGMPNYQATIDELLDRGLIETTRQSGGPRSARVDVQSDALTWLGHAGLIFSGGNSNVWVDPLLRPEIRWTPRDRSELFSKNYADHDLMDQYRKFPGPIPFCEFPPPDLVCITHQDVDHFDLGTLMMIPESVPIVVPQPVRKPWDVDLKAVIHRILGPRRKVIALGHHESITVGTVKVTAFPFKGEMPASLDHKWNCYLLETRHTAVACTADSVVADEALEFLARRLYRSKKLTVLCGRTPHDGRLWAGYRDSGETIEEFYNGSRLWGWYLPIGQTFTSVRSVGPSLAFLKELKKATGLNSYFPYAMGSTPWFRINDPNDLFGNGVDSISSKQCRHIGKRLDSIGLSFFPAKYGRPIPLRSKGHR